MSSSICFSLNKASSSTLLSSKPEGLDNISNNNITGGGQLQILNHRVSLPRQGPDIACRQAHLCEFRKNFGGRAVSTPEKVSLQVGN